jgi:hypothetical protein
MSEPLDLTSIFAAASDETDREAKIGEFTFRFRPPASSTTFVSLVVGGGNMLMEYMFSLVVGHDVVVGPEPEAASLEHKEWEQRQADYRNYEEFQKMLIKYQPNNDALFELIQRLTDGTVGFPTKPAKGSPRTSRPRASSAA